MILTFFRSLLLTSTFSFAAPMVLIGVMLIGLALIGQLPLVAAIGHSGGEQLLKFLVIFGNGDAFQGALIISLACGLVGALFDTYAFYRHQNLRDG